ncbi:MAG: hypothetical protein G01um101416_812 [Microgenomates group bacterium Gr01-1014_16]|nr:MAG: hypothetical protein G01um101416_812 [Microgenomates group bacterium Gr01-1014_16]
MTRIGLDFDGVVVYDPVRIIRAPVKWFKKNVLKKNKLSFFVPKNSWQRWVWKTIFSSSIWPAKGIDLLRQTSRNKNVEMHLITGRFDFMDAHLENWLTKYKLNGSFKSVNINRQEQPHLFKERMINELKLDYFVEDNLDVVLYLAPRVKAKILWIYNILDANKNYGDRFPYLEKALVWISGQ